MNLPAAPSRISIDVHVNDADNGQGRESKIAWNSTVDNTYMSLNGFKLLPGNTRALTPELMITGDCPQNNFQTCLRNFIQSFGLRAFRRPLTTEEVNQITSVANEMTPENAVREVIRAILVSADFLYKPDRAMASSSGASTIDHYTLASRISYFLWKSMPDKRLFDLAASGEIANMPGSAFSDLWNSPRTMIGLYDFLAHIFEISPVEFALKDAEMYPEFNAQLGKEIDDETFLFLRYVIFESQSAVKDLYQSKKAFLTPGTASIYGVQGIVSNFQEANLGNDRAGILTRSAYLATHAKDANSDHIRRAVAIIEDVICSPFTEPPGNFGGEDETPIDPNKTPRQNFEVLTQGPSCIGCHITIDPIGFSFDNFGALGEIRNSLGGKPIDTKGSFGFIGEFSSGVDLSNQLAEEDRVHMCMAERILQRVTGLSLERQDFGCSMQSGLEAMRASTFSLSETVRGLIYSDASLKRKFGSE